jgi:histone H1/5
VTKEKKPAAKKAAPKKEAAPKEVKEKKAAAPKVTKAAAPKKAAPKKAAAPKKVSNYLYLLCNHPSSNTAQTQAPAIVEKPTVLTKTTSGRVAKTAAKPAPPAKKAAPKKAAPKKAVAKKVELATE